jgi:ABC-type branched-subunit amino acid transport system substrate-binding protein
MLWMLPAAACSASPASIERVKIGVLLPYTGEASALSANLEKGSLLAAHEMNRAGGVGRLSAEVIFGNTFSDPEREVEQARALLDRGAVAVVGPGEDQVVPSLFELLVQADVALFSPLASATELGIGSSSTPWLRLAPTTKVLGQNLAKVVGDYGSTSIGTVVASDAYHTQLAEAFSERVASYASIDLSVSVDESNFDVQALTRQLSEPLDAGMQGVMLAMRPRPAARLATELAALRGTKAPPQWYLTPRLKTDLPEGQGAAQHRRTVFYNPDQAFSDSSLRATYEQLALGMQNGATVPVQPWMGLQGNSLIVPQRDGTRTPAEVAADFMTVYPMGP